MIGHGLRTIDDYLDLSFKEFHFVAHVLHLLAYLAYFLTHTLYFVFHAFHFTVDYFDIVTDVVCNPQVLCKCHPRFLLRQFVQLLECILQISPSGQSVKELLYAQSNADSYTANRKLTCRSPRQVFRRNPKDCKNFHHYLRNNICHRLSGCHLRICFEPFKEESHAFEQLCENIITRRNILGRL